MATGNGDATNLESFQSPRRAAFNGLALVLARTRPGEAGRIVVQSKPVETGVEWQGRAAGAHSAPPDPTKVVLLSAATLSGRV